MSLSRTFSTPCLPTSFTGRTVVLRLTACAMALSVAFAAPVNANPTGANVMAGQASIITQGKLTTITNSNGAVINWQSFSIGRDEITRFVQPSAASSVLNRVVSSDPSSILGQLQSNGRVFLINPAGILVGAGARIDVGGFVASSLNLRTEDFLANRLNFQATPGAGLVRNDGAISTPNGGQVFMVAPKVENAGVINAPGGEVVLAAGRAVQIGDTASPGVRIEVAGGETAKNLGSVAAEAGRIGLFGALVKNSGNLNASSAVAEGGRILLKATGSTVVDGDASLVANGNRGGRIEILGNEVALADRATIEASGRSGGGTLLVGGDYQGKNPEVQNAQVTWVGPHTVLRADATETGDGGKVVVWSDDTTRAYGNLSARGGAVSGNGGLIETSGKRYLDVEGVRVNASASNGQAGNWLLDPEELRIVENGSPGTDTNVTTLPNLAPAVGTALATLSADTLRNALNSNSNVTVVTAAGPGIGSGDITFDASAAPIIISKTGNTFSSTLDINAYHDIIFTGGTTTFKTTAGAGSAAFNVNLNAANGNPGGGQIVTNGGAAVILDGTPTAPVSARVGNGRIWTNNGTVNLLQNASIKLPYDNLLALGAGFRNIGTFNNATNGGRFIDATPSSGLFENVGVLNSNGGILAAPYQNNTGSTLNLLNGTSAFSSFTLLGGTVLISNATLAVGGNLTLDFTLSPPVIVTVAGNATMASGGNLVVNGGSLSAGNLTLLAAGNVVTNHSNIDASGNVSLGAGASVKVNGGVIGASSVAGTSISSTGEIDVGGAASVGNAASPTSLTTGHAKIGAGSTTSGSVVSITANDLSVGSGSSVVASDKLRAAVARNIMLDSTSGNSTLSAVNAINLVLGSQDSLVSLAGGVGGQSTIRLTGPAGSATRIFFARRTSGGVVVDGAQGIGPGAFNSSFRSGAGNAVLGQDLFISYGGTFTDVCKVLPGLCVVRAIVNAPPGANQPPKPPPKDESEGIGSFGEQATGAAPGTPNQRKRPGVCKPA